MDNGRSACETPRPSKVGRAGWIRLLETCGYERRRIAGRFGCSTATVSYHLKKHGLAARPKWRYRSEAEWRAILAPYANATEAANALGITRHALLCSLQARGIRAFF